MRVLLLPQLQKIIDGDGMQFSRRITIKKCQPRGALAIDFERVR